MAYARGSAGGWMDLAEAIAKQKLADANTKALSAIAAKRLSAGQQGKAKRS